MRGISHDQHFLFSRGCHSALRLGNLREKWVEKVNALPGKTGLISDRNPLHIRSNSPCQQTEGGVKSA
jgi:hypothetical protein